MLKKWDASGLSLEATARDPFSNPGMVLFAILDSVGWSRFSHKHQARPWLPGMVSRFPYASQLALSDGQQHDNVLVLLEIVTR
jgi:hypothetical protein